MKRIGYVVLNCHMRMSLTLKKRIVTIISRVPVMNEVGYLTIVYVIFFYGISKRVKPS